MLIENPDIFKSWLTSILEPLCDADPAALAKYVYALVKKDKPVEELREVMIDQLDVFLQAETKPFVEMLFKSLETNEYLKPREADKAPTPPPEPLTEKNILDNDVHATNGSTVEAPPPRHRVVVARAPAPPALTPAPAPAPAPPTVSLPPRGPHLEQTLVKVLPLSELLDEPVDQPPRRRDRRGDSLREKEDRRRRRSRSTERRVRARRHNREYDHDARRHDNRRLSRSASPRRYRNRSPPPTDRPIDRSRSRSPVSRGEAELPRVRQSERDRVSRDRDHRDRLSRDRERDRSRERSRDRSRGSGSPRDSRVEHNDLYKRRCRDFDEKGYCMRGDQCQWDHGNDPVVLEDNALTRVLAMPPPVPEYNPLVPDIWMGGGFAPFPPHHPPPRELIHIPSTEDTPTAPEQNPSACDVITIRHEAPPPEVPAAPRHIAPHKKNFDFNRLGKVPRPPPPTAANCSLEVKKVPRGMNDIKHLNNHFCKFGKIVNIQICFEGDPEAALITFSNPTEANVAYKSTEAVLNNRFIKVFWHNPDQNKDKPNAPEPSSHQPSHMSHNKVLVKRDNINYHVDNKNNIENKEKPANGQDLKKEAVKPPAVVDKSKHARELLEKQLMQQRRLIQKLESGNLTAAQKNTIMEVIKSTQEGIEKLQKELVSYQGTITMKMQVKAKKPKTREEAQKEILDAELDMFTKQQEGQDVTELVKKIDELRRQMAIQFPVHTTTIRRPHSRGGKFNTLTRYTRGAITKQFPGNQCVDHRPRALLISGFETDDLDSLYKHFSQFGEISSKQTELSVPQLTLVYTSRAHAQLAAAHGRHYNDRTLQITWVTNPKPAPTATPAAVDTRQPVPNGDAADEHKDEPSQQSPSETPSLRFEEEDEDENEEDRSWRR